MDQLLDVVRGLVAVVIAVAVLAAMAQVALGTSLDAVVEDVHRPVVVLFVGLMLVVVAREAWTVVQARR
jgi:succinate dehydrogenase hydrophobic anchor subunit